MHEGTDLTAAPTGATLLSGATRRSVYVRQEDLTLWEKAQRYARLDDGASLSAVIARSLREYVAGREAAELGMDRIQVEVLGVKKAFVGRWLVAPEEMVTPGEADRLFMAIAVTRRGQFAAWWTDLNNVTNSGLDVFPTLDALKYALQDQQDMIGSDFVALVRSRLDSSYVQELDI